MSTQQQAPVRMYAVVAAIAAIIGLGAIYVMHATGHNAGGAKLSETTAGGGDATPSIAASGRLNTGAMATFVFKDTPKALPAFTFNGPDGKPTSLTDWKGKVVLLNLWATWCAPCRKEMPSLDRLQDKLGSDAFSVVAVSIDRGDIKKPKSFLEEIKAHSLAFYHDPSAQLGFTLKAIGMPATLLINAQGQEIGRLVGPAEWDSLDAQRLIKAHLGK